MNYRQKTLLRNIIFVFFFTALMVTALISIRNSVNKSEAIRSMELIGREALAYRKNYGSLPPEKHIKTVSENIHAVRLANIEYRARWIKFGDNPETTILAYARKKYGGLTKPGYVVLFLDGRVNWLGISEFEEMLKKQQQKIEIEFLQKKLQQNL